MIQISGPCILVACLVASSGLSTRVEVRPGELGPPETPTQTSFAFEDVPSEQREYTSDQVTVTYNYVPGYHRLYVIELKGGDPRDEIVEFLATKEAGCCAGINVFWPDPRGKGYGKQVPSGMSKEEFMAAYRQMGRNVFFVMGEVPLRR